MNLWHDISPGENVPQTVNTIIEIPRGSSNKYEIDKETGLCTLDRVLYSAQFYPFDYGYVPQSYWYDGDPLDILLMTTYPVLPLTLVEARPVAVLHMIDAGDSDDKVICVPVGDPRFNAVTDLAHIDEHKKRELQNFFETYKMLQNKEVKVTGFEGAAAARQAVLEGLKLYDDKFKQ